MRVWHTLSLDRTRMQDNNKTWMWAQGGWGGGRQFVSLIFNSVGQFGWSGWQSRCTRCGEHPISVCAEEQANLRCKKVTHDCIISVTASAPQTLFTWASVSSHCRMNLSTGSDSSGGFNVKTHWLHTHASPKFGRIWHKCKFQSVKRARWSRMSLHSALECGIKVSLLETRMLKIQTALKDWAEPSFCCHLRLCKCTTDVLQSLLLTYMALNPTGSQRISREKPLTNKHGE